MITNQEIIDVYLAHKGMKHSNPEHRDDVRMLLPFFLMDVSYQIYCKDIKDYKCKHQAKAAKTRWKESYRQFNSDFFRPFSAEQIDFIIDQMDEFESYIHNHVVMLKSTAMSVFPKDAPFEEKKILASVLASNAVSQIAQHAYGDMFRDSWMRRKSNTHIAAVFKNSYDFARHFPVSQGIDITCPDNVSQMIDALCKEVIKFLKSKR